MDSESNVILIPNELCRQVGIIATWQSVNEFGLFPGQKPPKTDKPSVFASKPASVFHVRQEVILFQPHLRKLVNEANGIFLAIQEIKSIESIDSQEDLLSLSRQYRSILRACLDNLQEHVMREIGGIQRENLQNYITIFYSIECIWHLCEILFVDSDTGRPILPQLIKWIHFNFPKYERNAAIMLAGEMFGGLETHPDYWETVIGLFLQAKTNVVCALLKLHSQSDSQPFKLVDHCLRTMPTYPNLMSVEEFTIQRQQWKNDLQLKIEARSFDSCYNLNLLMKFAVGDELSWSQVTQQYCETWYELLTAWLYYNHPTVKPFELGQFARDCMAKMGVINRLKHLDRVLLATLEFDVLKVIKEVQDLGDNGWFVAHLTDLFYHCGKLDTIGVTSGNGNFSPTKLRESFLIEYATILLGHKSLWQVGLSYLDHCAENGLEVIKLLLPRLPLDSEMRTNKIVREALRRNLPETAQNICKIKGMQLKSKQRFGHALAWALKSQDSGFVSLLADAFLQHYVESGEINNCVDLLDNLGSSILMSDRLMFLGKYFEFHKLFAKRDYREAADLLVSLLQSKIVPNYFWPALLNDSIPLLECEEIVLNSNETYVILQCLENEDDLDEVKLSLDAVRVACSRNLARVLIVEAELM